MVVGGVCLFASFSTFRLFDLSGSWKVGGTERRGHGRGSAGVRSGGERGRGVVGMVRGGWSQARKRRVCSGGFSRVTTGAPLLPAAGGWVAEARR